MNCVDRRFVGASEIDGEGGWDGIGIGKGFGWNEFSDSAYSGLR